MAINKVGYNLVSEYQVSGFPFVVTQNATTTETSVQFELVTSSITITNHDTTNLVQVGFSSGFGPGNIRYYAIEPKATLQIDVKCKALYFKSSAGTVSYSLFAELTGIPATEMRDVSEMPVIAAGA